MVVVAVGFAEQLDALLPQLLQQQPLPVGSSWLAAVAAALLCAVACTCSPERFSGIRWFFSHSTHRMLFHVIVAQPLCLINEGPFVVLLQLLPLFAQSLRNLRIMHLRVLQCHLFALTT